MSCVPVYDFVLSRKYAAGNIGLRCAMRGFPSLVTKTPSSYTSYPWAIADNRRHVTTIPHVHDDVSKWKRFPRYWPFVRGIHRSPVNSPHKGQWRGALMFSLIYAWINGWVNNREAGDLRRHRAHYDVIVGDRLFRRRSKKHQSSASLAFVRRIHRWPVDSRTKGQ